MDNQTKNINFYSITDFMKWSANKYLHKNLTNISNRICVSCSSTKHFEKKKPLHFYYPALFF